MVEIHLGTIHKIRPLYESLYEQKWRKWKIFSVKNPHNNPYRTCIRVIMEIFRGGNIFFSSFLFIPTLIKWSYFVDDPLTRVIMEFFHFLHFCPYKLSKTGRILWMVSEWKFFIFFIFFHRNSHKVVVFCGWSLRHRRARHWRASNN